MNTAIFKGGPLNGTRMTVPPGPAMHRSAEGNIIHNRRGRRGPYVLTKVARAEYTYTWKPSD